MKRRKGVIHIKALDDDDDGETSADFTSRMGAQDEAFVTAMRQAIARGRETAREGIKVADPNDMTLRRVIRAPTRVRSVSNAYYD